MYFKLVLDVDAGKSWSIRAPVNGFSRALNPEKSFWDRFRAQAGDKEKVPDDINKLRVQIRNDLPKELRKLLVSKLATLLDVHDPGVESRGSETERALEALEIQVKRIRGGSLELLLFVLGFAKLVQLTGISPDDFAKCLEIVAPTAMNLIFGTAVSLEADATPSQDVLAGQPDRAAETAGSRIVSQSGGPYFVPAIFAAVAFAFAMWAFNGISSGLVDERKTLATYVHDEMENIGKERTAIATNLASLASAHETALGTERTALAGKAAELLSSLTTSTDKKDVALAAAQKTLFDEQMNFIRMQAPEPGRAKQRNRAHVI